ncbi:MAG: EF-hand domain-containing protein [Rhodoplanes sp.]|nr:EF-hand domain-containing protein [Rhodoplanes sp.]
MSAVDTDSDGSISKSELETFATDNGSSTSEADSLLKSLDQDGDGAVSTDELAKSLKTMVDALKSALSSSSSTNSVSVSA